jgi:hypothetical protein
LPQRKSTFCVLQNLTKFNKISYLRIKSYISYYTRKNVKSQEDVLRFCALLRGFLQLQKYETANRRCTKQRKTVILKITQESPLLFAQKNRAANSGLLALLQMIQLQLKNAEGSAAVLGGITGAILAVLVVSPSGVLVGVLVLVRGLGAVGGTIAGVALVRVLVGMLVFCILGAVLAVVRAVFHDRWLLSSVVELV